MAVEPRTDGTFLGDLHVLLARHRETWPEVPWTQRPLYLLWLGFHLVGAVLEVLVALPVLLVVWVLSKVFGRGRRNA